MIPVIIILAIALVALLIDWSWVKSFLAKRAEARPAVMRQENMQANAKPAFDRQPNGRSFVSAPTNSVETSAAQQLSQSPEIAELLEKADIAFRKGEFESAEQLYIKVAAKDPKCSKAYSRLGVIYLENGEDYADAEAAFRQALKFDQDNGYILNNLGLVLYHQDRFAEAVRYFESAVRIDEANANRHANLGKAYMAMRQYAKAESCFKKAMKLAPNELEYKDLMDEALEKKLAHKALVRR